VAPILFLCRVDIFISNKLRVDFKVFTADSHVNICVIVFKS